jgi:DNA-binding MarR family transcriptional regulator
MMARMEKKAAPRPSAEEFHPVRVIGSIFRVRRDLTLLIKKHVLPGAGLTLEEADLLMDLFGAAKLGWSDPAADEHGYVTFAALKASLVHSSSALSRRVAALQKAGLLETRKVHKIARDAKADRRSLALRITPAGIKRIEPVYERYAELCGRLLRDVPTNVRRTIIEINETLMEKARWGV